MCTRSVGLAAKLRRRGAIGRLRWGQCDPAVHGLVVCMCMGLIADKSMLLDCQHQVLSSFIVSDHQEGERRKGGAWEVA